MVLESYIPKAEGRGRRRERRRAKANILEDEGDEAIGSVLPISISSGFCWLRLLEETLERL